MAGENLVDKAGSAQSEAKRQKQVIIALWVFLAVLLVSLLAVLYGKEHGFRFIPQDATAAWPESWP